MARGKAQFVIDGGFMRGTDILKAVARGAAMVGIGKLQALALGAAGERGVVRMLEILETELTVSMKLLGTNTIADLDGHVLTAGHPRYSPSVLSALPLPMSPARRRADAAEQLGLAGAALDARVRQAVNFIPDSTLVHVARRLADDARASGWCTPTTASSRPSASCCGRFPSVAGATRLSASRLHSDHGALARFPDLYAGADVRATLPLADDERA